MKEVYVTRSVGVGTDVQKRSTAMRHLKRTDPVSVENERRESRAVITHPDLCPET